MTDDTHKSTNPPAPGFVPGLTEMGKQQFEAAAEMQRALLDTLEDLNRGWLAHVQSQLDLASELAGKLMTVRTIPDVEAACQQCLSRQLETAMDDGCRIVAAGQKVLRAGLHVLSNGRAANSAASVARADLPHRGHGSGAAHSLKPCLPISLTVLAWGPFSPISSANVTWVPTARRLNAPSSTLLRWK